eukprot:gnl/TRDRNA2_/TRDRNA2_134288_c0_seq1.p1 gnl/TRDRNA2_/TRDRNA2_134288_c0~~gnl/TRDRNA2_/TRDRNA2_134288_c0_seq1.p1  ORF type:complete len:379 (+),score=47.24 gnl/TRDRNA2_/TRDRNA2_134288_c0_seq1:61-1197(+)
MLRKREVAVTGSKNRRRRKAGKQAKNAALPAAKRRWVTVELPPGGFRAFRRAGLPASCIDTPSDAICPASLVTWQVPVSPELPPLELSSQPDHGAGMLGLWGAAPRLVNYLASYWREHVRDAHVVELGAGSCGAPGLACAVLGAKHVSLTDLPEGPVLPMLRQNVLRTRERFPTMCSVQVHGCAWGCHCPLTGRELHLHGNHDKSSGSAALAVGATVGTDGECRSAEQEVSAPMLVVGADIAYQPWNYPALWDAVESCRPLRASRVQTQDAGAKARCQTPPFAVLLALADRGGNSLTDLLELATAAGFRHKCVEAPRRGGVAADIGQDALVSIWLLLPADDESYDHGDSSCHSADGVVHGNGPGHGQSISHGGDHCCL